MTEGLSAEGIALLEQVSTERPAARASNPVEVESEPVASVRANAVLRLFTGPVRHVDLSAEEVGPLLKIPRHAAEDALEQLHRDGRLVRTGDMYRLASAVAQALPKPGDEPGGRPLALRNCRHCGDQFTSKWPAQKYCSRHATERSRAVVRKRQAVGGNVKPVEAQAPPSILAVSNEAEKREEPPTTPPARKPFTVRIGAAEVDCETVGDVLALVAAKETKQS